MGAKQKWINPRLHIFEKKISPASFGVKAGVLVILARLKTDVS
jgi:hypothetical protein